MATIIKNDGASVWVLADTDPQISIPASDQFDLELSLTRLEIAASEQLVADVANPSLSLTVNDGSSDLSTGKAVDHIKNRPTPGPLAADGTPLVRESTQILDRVDGYVTTTSTAFAAVRPSAYNEQTSNAQRSFDSSSTDDAAAGTGARKVKVTYYDQTMAGPFTEEVTLNGTTAVNTTATDIAFVDRIEVTEAGSQAGNVGTVRMHQGTGATGGILGQIEIGDNETNWTHHYVATGKTARVTDIGMSVRGVCAGQVHLRKATPTVANSVENTIDFVQRAEPGRSRVHSPRVPITVVGPARISLLVKPDTSTSHDWNGGFAFYEENT